MSLTSYYVELATRVLNALPQHSAHSRIAGRGRAEGCVYRTALWSFVSLTHTAPQIAMSSGFAYPGSCR